MKKETKESTKEELQESGIFTFEDYISLEMEGMVDLRERTCSSCKNKVPLSCSICYICETEDNI